MNVERFKKAIELIEKTPDEQINLRVWQKAGRNRVTSRAQANCGTIACAAGWIALDPEMQEEGMSVGDFGQPIYPYRGQHLDGFDALQYFFDIRDVEVDYLFESRRNSELVNGLEKYSDRNIWLRRAHNLLADYEA
jgi:hypothetical protein